MKTKKINSKLMLNKTTVARLNQKDLSALKGGEDMYTQTGLTCVFCDSDVSCVLNPVKCMYYMTCQDGCEGDPRL